MFAYNYIRSAAQSLKVTFGILAVFLIFSVLPATAQNGQSRNTSAAALHISINIVPIVYSPVRDRAVSTNRASVVYAIPAKPSQTDVIEQVSIVQLLENGRTSSKVLLKTTTIVPQ
jgi:hypothetical protein